MKLKVRVKNKDGRLFVKVKISSDFLINTEQSNYLSKNCNYGFFKLSNSKRNNLEFIGLNGISLYERFKKPISEYDFFFMIEQIVDITQKLEKLGLSRNNLVFDLKYVFFYESTKELSFIYLPIETPHNSIGILGFVEQIIYSVKPMKDDTKYLSNFNYFMKKFEEFDASKVESYIYEVNSEIVDIIKKVDYKKSEVVNKKVKNKRSGNIDNELTELMDSDEKINIMSKDDELTELFRQNAQMNLVFQSKKNAVDVDEENTYLLNDESTILLDDDVTELIDEKQAISYKFPTLIRTATDEVIKINKSVFRIGKEENCVDYIVTNNIAISRNHADIISRGGKYFVFDLRSKNKSYINNRVLPAEHEIEIFNGDVLKLANEEFLFHI